MQIQNRDTDILDDGALKIADAVKLSSLCRSTLHKAMQNGELAYVVPPGMRCRRIPRRALLDFLKRGLVVDGRQP